MTVSRNPSANVFRFGVFEADFRAGELRRNGIRVKIQDLPFRALKLLLDHPNVIVDREAFRDALWPPGIFVDFDRAISSAVKRLRDALGDSAENPIFIETVERRGYRWIAPIHTQEPAIEPLRNDEAQNNLSEVSSERKLTPLHTPAAFWRVTLPALSLLALLCAGWIFRHGIRNAYAHARSSPPAVRSPRQPANKEAEDFYLKGRYYWNKRTPESLNQAIDAFTQAIVRDPNYANAYMGLADCYNLLREYSVMPSGEAYSKAFAAAERAVELDPQSSEAHATLAFVTYWGIWDAPSAEKEFRKAVALDPRNPKAHHWFATFLHGRARHQEALSEIELARKLDPDSSAILADKAELLRSAGHTQEAMQLLTQLEVADPDFLSPHRYLRFAYFEGGDYPNYMAELKREAALTHDPATLAQAQAAARGFASGGEHGLLTALLAEQTRLYQKGKLSAYWVAETEARLGNKPEMLRYLSLCVQSHDDFVMALPADGNFTHAYGDPAFAQLLARAGLPAAI